MPCLNPTQLCGKPLTYLQCSQKDTTGNRNTDLIVVMGLLFSIWKSPIHLLKNEDQIGSCIQVFFDPICSEKRLLLRHIFICCLILFTTSQNICIGHKDLGKGCNSYDDGALKDKKNLTTNYC